MTKQTSALGGAGQSPLRPVALTAPLFLTDFAAFTLVWAPVGSAGLDAASSRLVSPLAGDAAERLIERVYPLGTFGVAWLVVICLSAVLAHQKRWGAGILVIGVMLALVCVEALLRVGSPLFAGSLTSAMLHPASSVLADGTYPSGHAARVALLVGITVSLSPRNLRGISWWGGAICVGLMAVERVASGAHSGSDVVGGLLLGAGLAATYAVFLPYVEARSRAVR